MNHGDLQADYYGGGWGGGCPPNREAGGPTITGGFGEADAPPTGAAHLSTSNALNIYMTASI